MVFHDDAARQKVAVQFAVQLVVAKADGGRFIAGVGEDDAADARPVGSGQAHRARLAGRIECGIGQVEAVDRGARPADGTDFGVCGRVSARHYPVPVFADNLAVADDDGAERAAFVHFAALERQFEGAGEETIVGVHSASGIRFAVENAEIDARRRLPARLAKFGNDIGEYAAAHVELGGQAHEARRGGGDQVVENAIGDGFVESALVAVGPNVELETLQFDAGLVRDVIENQRREIGLAGHRAQAGEFRNLHVNVKVAVDRRIGKGFEGSRRLAGHAQIHRNGVNVIIRPPSRWAIPEPAVIQCA